MEHMFWYNRDSPVANGEIISMASNNSHKVKRVFESVAGIFFRRFHRSALPVAHKYQPDLDISTLTTGIRALDRSLEIGGLPGGKITELVSPTSSMAGANSVAARIAAKAQRKQQRITIIDMNHSFDPWQAERAGLIAPHLLLTRPDTVFEALTALEGAARYTESLTIVVMGVLTELFNQVDVSLLRNLFHRVRAITAPSDGVFLFLTVSPQNAPFNPANYPTGFPLAELAEVRLWLQDENWSYKEGAVTTYKANLTVIKNGLAVAGKGTNVTIKFSPPGPFGA
jgi:recombination protein RecA